MSSQSGGLVLEARLVTFYSPGDEDVFFGWLRGLACVNGVEGRGVTLYISIDPERVGEDELRELLALFHRYGVDMAQLKALDRDEFAGWFRRADAFWSERVFG